MKKTITVLFIMALMLLLCSCGVMKPVKLYGELKTDENIIDLTNPQKPDTEEYPGPEPYKTAVIDGKEYVGEFCALSHSPLYDSDANVYKCDADGGELRIYVNRKDGGFMGYDFYYENNKGEKTYEECLACADAAFEKLNLEGTYVHDGFMESSDGSRDTFGNYNFHYVKMLDGIATYDFVDISVSSRTEKITKTVYTASRALAGVTHISYDEKSCEKMLGDYLSKFERGYLTSMHKSCDTEVMAKYFTRLCDGRYGIIYFVYYKLYSGEEAPDHYSGGIRLFIELE